MVVRDTHVFPAFLTQILTKLFFPKPLTTFLTCFCRGERRKYAGKKVCLNRVSDSQPPGRESDTLTAEPSGRGKEILEISSQQTCENSLLSFRQLYRLNSDALKQ